MRGAIVHEPGAHNRLAPPEKITLLPTLLLAQSNRDEALAKKVNQALSTHAALQDTTVRATARVALHLKIGFLLAGRFYCTQILDFLMAAALKYWILEASACSGRPRT